mgnify:CR=1 FL=1
MFQSQLCVVGHRMNQSITLTILIRVEPGSLGPDGLDHIESFCQFCQKVFSKTTSKNLDWQIIPRYDKTLPEMSVLLNNKHLNIDKAEQLLALYQLSFDELEENSMERISNLIDRYLGHEYD